ncbi:MAG TPA: hypothetical protein VF925_02935 [Casimicrobiaceae bacterium]|jgi:hypothetical protein
MGKIIFWLVIGFGALLALRLLNVAKSSSRDGAKRGDATSGAARQKRGRDAAMVRCVGCGVFLPRVEAVATPRGPTCGDARCQRLGRRDAA